MDSNSKLIHFLKLNISSGIHIHFFLKAIFSDHIVIPLSFFFFFFFFLWKGAAYLISLYLLASASPNNCFQNWVTLDSHCHRKPLVVSFELDVLFYRPDVYGKKKKTCCLFPSPLLSLPCVCEDQAAQ